MSEEQFDDHPGLLDEDPALDYVLYKEMEKEDKRPRKNGGCLSLVLFSLLPPATFKYLYNLIA
ncbi:MAG: hypothetical protein OEM01_10080 [Desulfobulbaceae bacterium]|nr:hypothetical protein [Desulfobulbaceae bacterium]